MPSKKRKRGERERPRIHPRNKYSENPPDFGLLASHYSSFAPYVFYARSGRPTIDWTDFNATRELTRVLLHHDHGLDWWIPDGQLCPTVPNRSNYIHWIEDLLSSEIIPKVQSYDNTVKGFDIGTGANCIYPLLGASLLGWRFVGSDFTDVALEWAERNVKSNPHISELIEIRNVATQDSSSDKEVPNGPMINCKQDVDDSNAKPVGIEPLSGSHEVQLNMSKNYHGPPILVGVVKEGENFDFCMCNPPFFETIEEAGQNPKTSCAGTPEEMVCPGGEQAFITRMIDDSVQLRQSFRWYTSMIGRKASMKVLVSKLWEVGATVVKTTEFVQGQTCRWGLAWSFVPPTKKTIPQQIAEKSNLSFMLEGLQRQHSAFNLLQSVESFFSTNGASCKLNAASFDVDIMFPKEHPDVILKSLEETNNVNDADCPNELDCSSSQINDLHFRVSVFQQIPGTLLVRGSLQKKDSSTSSGFYCAFSSTFQRLEGFLRNTFCRERTGADASCCTKPRR
nr:U6 small nuclear RNA (adenine-(43)-N(6))-methyltransferase isoform X1 [Ipomoea batatas]